MISVAFDFSKLAAKLDNITAAAEKATRPAAQAGTYPCRACSPASRCWMPTAWSARCCM